MKKIWYLCLALLVFTGCQKHELSDLELVKTAREYMSVMNPGEVEKASASVNNMGRDYNLSKDKMINFRTVLFYIHETLPNNRLALHQWRVRFEDDKAVQDVFLTQEKWQEELQQRKLPSNQARNCWGNYLSEPDWVKDQKKKGSYVVERG